MDREQLLVLMKQAEEKGGDLAQLLKEELDKEAEKKKLGEEKIAVQIMPNHTIAKYGSFPWVGMMPRKKAIDLARYGQVNILRDKEDIIEEDDIETIRFVLEEGMDIRRSLERDRMRRKPERVNCVPPKVSVKLDSDVEIFSKKEAEEEVDVNKSFPTSSSVKQMQHKKEGTRRVN